MPTWTVAGVQMDCKLTDKPANLRAMTDRLAAAADRGAKLVVFPECALTGYGFESREQAVAYAAASGIAYEVEATPPSAAIKPKVYADNFRFGRLENWSH